MTKISVGILGATGTVGQRFIQLLAGHPWFEVAAVAASDRSAGKRYDKACHWLLPTEMPGAVGQLRVGALEPGLDCQLVFSALPSSVAGPVEEHFARAGYVVCSNAAPFRLAEDVPLLIPEVNAEHTALIDTQREGRRWTGLIVTSANCTTTQLALALKPLQDAFGLRKASVVSMQALSGAGYPGVPSMDILGNIVPFIGGEEEKVESEALKLLGTLRDGRIVDSPLVVGAQCNRVPVKDGHTECVSLEFERKAEPEEVVAALDAFRGASVVSGLPSSPGQPIVVRGEPDRPQPARDRDTGGGMSIVVGRVRPCPILDIKLVVLGHNTVRGAAGGSIHNAELLVAQGWLE
ncbi:aspartate-semialdehyde dehydrogenase [Chloroflexota bacterium]